MSSEKIEVIEHQTYDTDVNLMAQDAYHMAQVIGSNVTIMFATHPDAEMRYLIVVDTTTGSSVRLNFPKVEKANERKAWNINKTKRLISAQMRVKLAKETVSIIEAEKFTDQ